MSHSLRHLRTSEAAIARPESRRLKPGDQAQDLWASSKVKDLDLRSAIASVVGSLKDLRSDQSTKGVTIHPGQRADSLRASDMAREIYTFQLYTAIEYE